jgi:hypothetical protein
MDDLEPFPNDPRALDLAQRRQWQQRLSGPHSRWTAALAALSETRLGDEFPAFLLATPPFAELAASIEGATHRSSLPLDVLDRLDRFLEAFADYLRTQSGENVFDGRVRRAS